MPEFQLTSPGKSRGPVAKICSWCNEPYWTHPDLPLSRHWMVHYLAAEKAIYGHNSHGMCPKCVAAHEADPEGFLADSKRRAQAINTILSGD